MNLHGGNRTDATGPRMAQPRPGNCEMCDAPDGTQFCNQTAFRDDYSGKWRSCTRPKGHDGEHVACDGLNHNLARWE